MAMPGGVGDRECSRIVVPQTRSAATMTGAGPTGRQGAGEQPEHQIGQPSGIVVIAVRVAEWVSR